jgi:hypothetical protein
LHDNGIDFVRGVAVMHCKSPFGFAMIAANIGVKPRALETFLAARNPLPPEAMEKLVEILFHGRARWDEETQMLADVVKPATAMMDASDMAPTTINAPAGI